MRRRSAETSESVGSVSESSEDSRLGSSSAIRDRWVVALWKLLFLSSLFFVKLKFVLLRSDGREALLWREHLQIYSIYKISWILDDDDSVPKTINSSHNAYMSMSLSSTNSWGKSEEIKYPKINTSFGNNSSLWWCVGDKWTKPLWKLPFIDSQFCVKWKFLLLISEGRVHSVKSVSLNPPNFQDLLNLVIEVLKPQPFLIPYHKLLWI